MGGLCQMLTFAYNVGGWVIANAYVSKILKYLEKKWKLIHAQKVEYKSYYNYQKSVHTPWYLSFYQNFEFLNFARNYQNLAFLLASKSVARWVGLKKSYVINRVGFQKSYVCLQGGWVGQKRA